MRMIGTLRRLTGINGAVLILAATLWNGMAANAEAAGFRVFDEQIQTDPSYDFRAKVYSVNNGVWTLIATENYDYVGSYYMDGYGWFYKWRINELIFPADEDATVMYQVEYRYGGGAWTYFFTSSAPEE